MTDIQRMDVPAMLGNALSESDPDILRSMVQAMAEMLMSAEVDGLCGAPKGVRSEDRTNQRNGYRTRRWDTRAGTIQLAIPKVRRGSYFPDWLLEHRKRAERALVAVVAESYVHGVSTRKVDDVVRALGIEGISKSQVSELAKSLDEMVASFRNRSLAGRTYPYVWVDALVVKVRECGCVVNVACIIATAVNDDGHREVLGVDVITEEDGVGWTAFLRHLKARGLSGVKLVISDAHAGLKDAIASTFPGASWQRCRTHFTRNVLTKVPKSAQPVVATLVRSIFAQGDADEVRNQQARVVEQLEGNFAKASNALANATEEVLAFTAFPKEHWRNIWSNNPQERLNKELRRRTDVVGIFPNRDAIIRLIGAVLIEQHDEWQVARRYMSQESLKVVVAPATDAAQGALPEPPDSHTRRRAQAGSGTTKSRAKRVGAKRKSSTRSSTTASRRRKSA